ncbi:MAG: hypothetical protein ACXAEU_20055 [Candidatus Hodarchaeales archaeon]
MKKGYDLLEEQRFIIAEKLDFIVAMIDSSSYKTDIEPFFGGKIHPGGQSTLFVYEFPLTKDLSLAIKPYDSSKTTLDMLVLHYLSTVEFERTSVESRVFDTAQVTVMPMYSLGVIKLPSRSAPFSVQKFSKGKKASELLAENRHILKLITGIYKNISYNGFIIDPLPSNWYINNEDTQLIAEGITTNLDYIDLLSYDRADEKKIKAALREFHGDEF